MARNTTTAREFFDQLSPYADIAYGPSLNNPTDQNQDITDPLDQVKQNFRTLLLTSPGEKLSDPQFGIGIQNFIFEMNIPETEAQIKSRINSQAKIYMSYINITNIQTSKFQDNDNGLYLAITYYVPEINQQDRIVINFPENR
jgi:phage baseplate assembly protein W